MKKTPVALWLAVLAAFALVAAACGRRRLRHDDRDPHDAGARRRRADG